MSDAPSATPEAPADEPKGLLDKLGAALPVALTAIATAFAGMSTTELSRAMYWKSQAAQDQAKATNQWTLAGFKRDRSLLCQTTAASLRAQAGFADPGLEGEARAHQGGPAADSALPALAWLTGAGPPPVKLPDVPDERVTELLKAIQAREPEAELLRRAAGVPAAVVTAAIDAAEKAVERTDAEWDPVVKAAAKYVQGQGQAAARNTGDEKARPAAVARAAAVQAAGFELEQRRYRAESTLNQGVGFLYEARVKVSGAESDRHRHKSETFFYAMLAAQVGATVSALGLARKHKSLMWTVAGLAGAVSVAIGAYVYLS